MVSPTPLAIEPLTDKTLRMKWNTGESFELPYFELRFECPCAACVNEHTGERMIRKESIDPNVRVMQARPIGRYAIQFEWSDGHGTGMYHFDRLYTLCLNSSHSR